MTNVIDSLTGKSIVAYEGNVATGLWLLRRGRYACSEFLEELIINNRGIPMFGGFSRNRHPSSPIAFSDTVEQYSLLFNRMKLYETDACHLAAILVAEGYAKFDVINRRIKITIL